MSDNKVIKGVLHFVFSYDISHLSNTTTQVSYTLISRGQSYSHTIGNREKTKQKPNLQQITIFFQSGFHPFKRTRKALSGRAHTKITCENHPFISNASASLCPHSKPLCQLNQSKQNHNEDTTKRFIHRWS